MALWIATPFGLAITAKGKTWIATPFGLAMTAKGWIAKAFGCHVAMLLAAVPSSR